jgi:hypothetical protein
MKTVNLRPLLVYSFTVFVVMLWASLLFGARPSQAQGEVTGTPTDTPTVIESTLPPPAPRTPTATASALHLHRRRRQPCYRATDRDGYGDALPELPHQRRFIAQCPDLYESTRRTTTQATPTAGQQFHTSAKSTMVVLHCAGRADAITPVTRPRWHRLDFFRATLMGRCAEEESTFDPSPGQPMLPHCEPVGPFYVKSRT